MLKPFQPHGLNAGQNASRDLHTAPQLGAQESLKNLRRGWEHLTSAPPTPHSHPTPPCCFCQLFGGPIFISRSLWGRHGTGVDSSKVLNDNINNQPVHCVALKSEVKSVNGGWTCEQDRVCGGTSKRDWHFLRNEYQWSWNWALIASNCQIKWKKEKKQKKQNKQEQEY